jgi:Cytochrome c554 and c-prime
MEKCELPSLAEAQRWDRRVRRRTANDDKMLRIAFMRWVRGRSLLLFGLAAICFVVSLTLRAQQPATIADQLSTPERLRKYRWWPTQTKPAREDYVGNAACAQCHASIAVDYESTSMAQTSVPAADSEILRANPLKYQLGPYTYQITQTPQGASYVVSDGANAISGDFQWGFGVGKMGQSYLFDYQGKTYLVPLSYYGAAKVWDFTVDVAHAIPVSLQSALGLKLSAEQRRGCFDCHTTATTTSGDHFEPERAVPGVTCESCHGPGADHIAAVNLGVADSGYSMIFNPKGLNPTDSVDFCGACHRTWWDVVLMDERGPKSLRFPVYRLEKSRCWGKGDPRITCVACHDPHKSLVQDDASYDRNCLSCHTLKGAPPASDHPGAACPVATKDCVNCHMPKSEAAFVHSRFTDHMIRVVRPGEKFSD